MEPNLNLALVRRLCTLAGLLGCGFVLLAGRLVYLQGFPHEKYARTAAANHHQEILREPRRGEIRDVRGRVLASSKFVKTICAEPWLVGDSAPQLARVIAPLLEIPELTLVPLLQQRYRLDEKGRWVTNKFVFLKNKVPNETWQKVRTQLAVLKLEPSPAQWAQLTAKTNRTALMQATNRVAAALLAARTKAVYPYELDDQQREYANKTLAAHVIGFLDQRDNQPIRGIEFTMNRQLTGVRGWRTSQTDAHKREVVPQRAQDVSASDGNHVALTLDATVQYYVEEALAEALRQHAPLSISGLVVRPKTGEILAMATLPTVDLNAPAKSSVTNHYNRSISTVSEPGSTFKIVVVAAALNEGLVSLRDKFDCENGAFHYGGRILHDHEPYGILSVEEIITKSSNIGAAKIGLKLGEQKLHDYIRAFGFGERSHLNLDREEKGIVHARTNWTKISNAWIPMGHEVMVTQLQMTMAMCAIANGGRLMTPILVDHVEDGQGNVVARTQPQMVRQVVSPEAARLTVQALKTVVGTNGTAAKARLDWYTVAGKTGTAQKALPFPVLDSRGHAVLDAKGQPKMKSLYVRGKYFSSFIGFFPADEPEICISVVLDEPVNGHYGGQTAAPVFKRIAEQVATYLNIRPDVQMQEAATGAAGMSAAAPAPTAATPTRVAVKRSN